MAQPVEIKRRIRLKDFDPADEGGWDKEQAKERAAQLAERIGELQELLYANARHSIVLLFQGMDASGKDGAVRKVLSAVNPAGVETWSFKAPSAEERAHDFLWRHHEAMPRYGFIGVHNRSHYEAVLVERALKLAEPKVWKARYAQINEFEKILAQNRVIILKFFLHISKEEQKERMESRLKDPKKKWKFNRQDLEIRARWDEFMKAYEDAINACSTAHCRWHVIPADRNWRRDLLVAEIVAQALESLKMTWPKPAEDFSRIKIK